MQCELFWLLQSSSEFSGVSKDSKFPLLGVWVSSSHLTQSGVATQIPSCQNSTWSTTHFCYKSNYYSPSYNIYIFLYNILGFVRLRWSSFPSIRPVIRPVIHPSKFLILEEEDDGRGEGRRMAAGAVYRNVYVIQSCSLWKTLIVLQFAKHYILIFKN